MEYDFEINLLSQKFINDYPLSSFPELMYKDGRPYNCLLVDTHADYFICIPFRTSVPHKNSYHFKDTQRSRLSQSGLDFSKIAIISNSDYIDNKKAIVDQDEYNETVKNISKIVSQAVKYVDTYINHINGTKTISAEQYARLYQYSTLPYFHDILGL